MLEDIKIDSLLQIEKKYSLYDETIEGVNFWIYSRFELWNKFILKEKYDIGEAHNTSSKTRYERLKQILQLVRRALFERRIVRENVDVCFVNHPRRVYRDGYYECKYTDKLIHYFPNSAILERPFQNNHFLPVKTDNLMYLDYIYLGQYIMIVLYKTILRNKSKKLREEIYLKVESPLNEIENAYQVKLDKRKIVDMIQEQIICCKAIWEKYDQLIGRLNPKVMIEVVSYSRDCMIINEICKNRKIPTVELQHGVMNDALSYSYETDGVIKQFPDKVFLFSEFWKRIIKCPIESHNLISTGFPFFDQQMIEAIEIPEYADGKINILFISQGTIGKRLSELAIRLSQILDMDKYRVLYKLHPGEYSIWDTAYKDLKDERIVIISDNKYSLYDYFATCQIQVGVYSTALYEGLGFGLETFIYDIELSSYMDEICNAGYARFVKDYHDLYRCISCAFSKKTKPEKFWEPDALNNIIYLIEEMLKQTMEDDMYE